MGAVNLPRHIKARHAEEDEPVAGEFTEDEPPQPKRGRPRGSTTQKATPKTQSSPIPLRVQLEIPYKLGATLAQSRGYATAAAAMRRQAPECAAAWDDFLKRWPALYEMLEKGMIGADVVRLFMAHYPILQAVREEQMRRVQMEQAYADQGGDGVAAAA